jgi:hypothetical protein
MRIQIDLPDWVLAALQSAADEDNRTRKNYIETLLTDQAEYAYTYQKDLRALQQFYAGQPEAAKKKKPLKK